MADPKTRVEWIDQNWGATPPVPWTIENEFEMPEPLRDLSWIEAQQKLRYPEDFDVENDHPDLPGRLVGTAILKRKPKESDKDAEDAKPKPPWTVPRFKPPRLTRPTK